MRPRIPARTEGKITKTAQLPRATLAIRGTPRSANRIAPPPPIYTPDPSPRSSLADAAAAAARESATLFVSLSLDLAAVRLCPSTENLRFPAGL
ncbi:hypothetical protein NL676_030718 [Syzygium grande]|nr:hypothetical protein NL676_030718 [Syzygium grande]